MVKSFVKKIIRCFKLDDYLYEIMKISKSKKASIPYQEALQHLSNLRFDSNGTSIGKNKISNNIKYDLQIVVPVYNCEKYVKECLDSILYQKTKYKFKVIVVDDGSTDSSGNIVDQYKKYDNFSIIHKSNGGLSSARNKGIEVIDAKYILFVDADDYLMKDSLDGVLDLSYELNADIVSAGFYRKEGNKISVYSKYRKVKEIKNSLEFDMYPVSWT